MDMPLIQACSLWLQSVQSTMFLKLKHVEWIVKMIFVLQVALCIEQIAWLYKVIKTNFGFFGGSGVQSRSLYGQVALSL